MRLIVVALVIVGVLLPMAGAFAQAPPPPPNAGAMRLEPRPCPLMALRFIRPTMVPMFAKALNLTSDQISKITDLLTKGDEALKPKVEDQRNASKEFGLALANPNATQAAIVSAFEKTAKAESAMIAEMVKTLFAVRALLTDQQKTEFNKMIESRTEPWTRDMMTMSPRMSPAQPAPPPPPGEIPPPPTDPAR